MNDKQLTCRDCGAPFTFTASEQDFYQQKGFTNEPTRCPSCRAEHKANRNSGGGGYGGGGYGGGGGRREMFTATCSQCGQEAQVPFRPSGDKPVYCSNCFEGRRSGGGGRDSSRDRGRRW